VHGAGRTGGCCAAGDRGGFDSTGNGCYFCGAEGHTQAILLELAWGVARRIPSSSVTMIMVWIVI